MTLRALYDLPAPAKLNLFLHIVGRRPDGYHLLESVFVLIDWADTLHLEARTDGKLQRHDLGPALPADDLCLRAARALQSASGTGLGADISIQKNVPWGAGMGGGSSDAATTLLALNRLWGLNWPRARLAQLGLALGADVPFFVGGHNAFVQGVGEQLTPLALAPACYAVLKPASGIATRSIFEHPALVRNTKPIAEAGKPAAILMGSFEGAQSSLVVIDQTFGKNDLQAPAEDQCSEVAQAAGWLKQRFGNSRMTGSGSAVFSTSQVSTSQVSTSQDKADAPQAAWPTETLPTGWVGRMCKSLPQHPMVGWAD
jgi:4-diphosphocytidyl-2-C-methyl-D-erythritol kinase